ncbi:MAG TPA: RluA family pseudouridine synthase [Geobacteraceae bacterium]|nr:RluA family pseudouridine synthase [Geobacteraceae bacterium]
MKLAPARRAGYTPPMLTYTITESDHCRSIESFLRNLLPTAPLSYLKKLVTSGHLILNGAPVSAPDALLRLDDTVTLKESGKTKALLMGRRMPLDILHEDGWIIVFNKAPGLAMHRAAEVDERNLVDLGGRLLAERDGFAGKLRPVNRLDRGTSGAVVLAKSPTAAGMFGRLLKEEGLAKVYLAVVQGKLPEEGRITVPLEGKEAETGFRSLFQGERSTLAAVYPVTGRMHQIRQHFQAIGHPVAGDRRYGGRALPGYEGILLHSFRTSFTHPATGEHLTICAPLPAGFRDRLRELAGEGYLSLLRGLPDIP